MGVRFHGPRSKMKQMLQDVYDINDLPLYLERKYQKAKQALVLLDHLIATHHKKRSTVYTKGHALQSSVTTPPNSLLSNA